jgi:ABC-type sugar transport system ATPase subunit
MGNNNVLLEIKNLRKEFPGVVAVNDVSFDIKKGEVHIVVGENGAGKSTLVKMIAGLYSIDKGEMILDGEKYHPQDVLDAQAHGVNIIHQELSMMANRTVAQNMFVGREPVKKNIFHFVDTKRMNNECKKQLESLGMDISPTTLVKDLSIAQQQMVEVAKALTTKNKLLIMDEPTSSLTQKEIDNLFRITRQLTKEGISIIYISHRLQELMEIGDRVTVMRDGSYIGTYNIGEITMDDIISKMVGRKIENVYNRTYFEPGEELLRTENLEGLRFRRININVRAREIVGLAGLVGAGRTELAKAIFGYDRIESGSIYLFGKGLKTRNHNTKKSIESSISFLPEDRKGEGLLVRLSIKDNVVLANLSQLYSNGVVDHKKNRKIAEKYVDELSIKTTSVDKKVFNLSGGNQQKVVLAKWLLTKSRIFIFDEPTRGIDVGAKSEIYALMNELAKNGAGILMISSDLPELIGLADRIYVMKDGEISGEVNHNSPDFTQENILDLAIKGAQGK